MKKILGIIILLVAFISCDESWIGKPKELIPEKQMVDMLVDIHLSNSMFSLNKYPNADSLKLKPADFYYSVLNKYNVTDTVFEESLIYYSSYSKDFEKMYAKVLDKVSQLDQEFGGKEDEPVDIGNIKKK